MTDRRFQILSVLLICTLLLGAAAVLSAAQGKVVIKNKDAGKGSPAKVHGFVFSPPMTKALETKPLDSCSGSCNCSVCECFGSLSCCLAGCGFCFDVACST